MEDRISRMVNYHLENIVRSATDEEKTIQVTSRLPASLKIRLDLCASYLDLTRNSFLIDLLGAALPTVEQALRDSHSVREECGLAGNWGPYTYDEALKAFTEEFDATGKEFRGSRALAEAINQANTEFSATGKTSPEMITLLRELGYPENFLTSGDTK